MNSSTLPLRNSRAAEIVRDLLDLALDVVDLHKLDEDDYLLSELRPRIVAAIEVIEGEGE